MYCQHKTCCHGICWTLAIQPCLIQFRSAISKPAMRSSYSQLCFNLGFCLNKWFQTLCPTISCRHSVWAKLHEQPKTHFYTHQNKITLNSGNKTTIYCQLYWKSSCRWFDFDPGHHFPANKSKKTQKSGVLCWGHYRDRFMDQFVSKPNLETSV